MRLKLVAAHSDMRIKRGEPVNTGCSGNTANRESLSIIINKTYLNKHYKKGGDSYKSI